MASSINIDILNTALDKAVAFLAQDQLPHGEFRTILAADAQLKQDCEADSSPFVTSFVLYALHYIENERTTGMIKKGLDFLESEMEWPGMWRHYSSRQFKHWRIPPDLEDTACAAYTLKMYNRAVPGNENIFLRNKNEQGIFRTWLTPQYKPFKNVRQAALLLLAGIVSRWQTRIPVRPEKFRKSPRYHSKSDPVPLDAIDPSNNISTLLYLGETTETRDSINYIKNIIINNQESGSSCFYRDNIILYYMISRAFLHSVPSLGALKKNIVERISQRYQKNETWDNDLIAALAACTLLSFRAKNTTLDKAVEHILNNQQKNGSWQRDTFYSGPTEFWGSEALTTAFCIEALARYRQYLIRIKNISNTASFEGKRQEISPKKNTAPSRPQIKTNAASFKFDISAPKLRQDPYPYYRELRHHAPVYYNKTHDHWVISRHRDVATVLKEASLFSSTIMAPMESTMLGADAPDHPRVRKSFTAAFNRKRIAAFREEIENQTNCFIDKVIPAGQCDLIADLAIPLPIAVIATVMGFPIDRLAEYKRWSDAAVLVNLSTLSPASRKVYNDDLASFFRFIEKQLEIFKQQPDGDTLGHIIAQLSEKESFTREQTLNLAKVLFTAGHETTTSVIGSAALILLKNPALQDKIRENPALIPPFIEEVLRYESPVQFVRRRTLKSAEISGVKIPAGAEVFALIGAANRDEEEFPDPDQFNIERNFRTHLVFGYGPHYCIGAQLSRMEAAIAIKQLVSRFNDIQATQRLDDLEYFDVLQLRSIKHLGLIFESK